MQRIDYRTVELTPDEVYVRDYIDIILDEGYSLVDAVNNAKLLWPSIVTNEFAEYLLY